MTDAIRLCAQRWTLTVALAVMIYGYVSSVNGQSQDTINARLIAQAEANDQHDRSVDAQIEKINDKLWYGLVGITLQIAAHLWTATQTQRRKG